MKVSTRASAAYVLSLVLCTVLLLAMALPAAAAKPAGKGKAKAHRATTTAVTEDTDTNDGDTPNNVADEGDNKHPSGKDKSVERGGSGNQGNSTSDPDDDGRGPDRSNGGADKPDGPGGVDLADQDGNNGCGNDDDFEDDNEGWCGAKPKPAKPAAQPAEQPAADDGACTPGTVGCAPAKDEDVDSCTVGSEGCTPAVEETCDVASGECLGHADGECGTVAADCTSDDEVAGSDGETPALVDKDVAATDEATDAEGDVLGAEGSVEGETDVAGVAVERGVVNAAVGRVLGAEATTADLAGVAAGGLAGVASRSLAATGSPMLVLGLLALGGMGLGAGLLRRTRKH